MLAQPILMRADPTATDSAKCQLRHLDGNVRVTIIAMSIAIGVLAFLLLWSCCCPNPCKKKKKLEIRM